MKYSHDGHAWLFQVPLPLFMMPATCGANDFLSSQKKKQARKHIFYSFMLRGREDWLGVEARERPVGSKVQLLFWHFSHACVFQVLLLLLRCRLLLVARRQLRQEMTGRWTRQAKAFSALKAGLEEARKEGALRQGQSKRWTAKHSGDYKTSFRCCFSVYKTILTFCFVVASDSRGAQILCSPALDSLGAQCVQLCGC